MGTGAGLVRFDPKGTPANRVRVANESDGRPSPMFGVVLPEPRTGEPGRSPFSWKVVMAPSGAEDKKHLYRLSRRDGPFALLPTQSSAIEQTLPQRPSLLTCWKIENGTLSVTSLGWLRRRWPDGSAAALHQARRLARRHGS